MNGEFAQCMDDAYVLQNCRSSLDKFGRSVNCMSESDIARQAHRSHECHGRYHTWTVTEWMSLWRAGT
ncbi:uncharacterized protein LAESUDRAFT_731374 [Laetiporus sulphureus 93-53]|uniref:Uncharacterized protein n=1 Tax=Laetiporus sulphureus 93-53 TaxID=1314785 RepID=A0A165BLV5_9APHY|nr:uncharacterized protein LAESUDRAFT_731374 [Laetiporus sulphureus 93-53]KZT01286.1 hypothetical protein LAESUDRAFT_731374 [Laetiporus sulphureus 93-53]